MPENNLHGHTMVSALWFYWAPKNGDNFYEYWVETQLSTTQISQRSSGMKMSKFIGLCIVFSFVASLQRKPLTYLKILEIGMCIIISMKRLRWMSVVSQSPEMWYAPKAQSTKLL